MKKDTKIAYVLFLIAFGSYCVKFGLNVFLSHHLLPALYGDLKIAIHVLTLLTGFILFGTNTGVIRFLAAYKSDNEENRMMDFIAWNLKLVSRTIVISFVVAFVAFVFMILLHQLHINDLNQYHMAVYMFWIAPFSAAAVLLNSYLFSEGKVYFPSFMASLLKYGLMLVLFTIAVLFLKLDLTNNLSLMIPILITFVFLIILGALFINPNTFFFIMSATKKFKDSSIIQSEWFTPSWKFISNNTLFMIVCVLDLIIIEIFDLNESNVGYYAAALICSGIIWVAPTNLYQALNPKISHLLKSTQGRHELQSRADATNKVVVLITTISFIFIVIFSSQLLAIFGPDYPSAKITLIIISTGSFIRGIARFSSVILVYSGYEEIPLKITISELLIISIAGSIATHYFGILGMATVSCSVMILGATITVLYAHKKVGIRSTLFF